jgi:Leucine-rich repeat (LRR) protein
MEPHYRYCETNTNHTTPPYTNTQQVLIYITATLAVHVTGTIPASLGTSVPLQRLFLNGNQLTGAIPASLAGCTSLVQLWLRGNQLSGELPDFGRLAKLEQLNLSRNQLTGPHPISRLSRLPALKNLQLDGNLFSASRNRVNTRQQELSSSRQLRTSLGLESKKDLPDAPADAWFDNRGNLDLT